MRGVLPSTLHQLRHLKTLALSNNHILGPLPAELGKIETLTWVALHDNQALAGPIPPSMTSLKQLVWFTAYNTGLSGPLPAQLSDLRQLEVLQLHNTQLSGPLPPNFHLLRKLRILYVKWYFTLHAPEHNQRHNGLGLGAVPPMGNPWYSLNT